ncbi:hypothetical protein [Synechococcus phage DSL-LC03]|nr:hypothetical protein [Synechococcus phage DSL-LC03]
MPLTITGSSFNNSTGYFKIGNSLGTQTLGVRVSDGLAIQQMAPNVPYASHHPITQTEIFTDGFFSPYSATTIEETRVSLSAGQSVDITYIFPSEYTYYVFNYTAAYYAGGSILTHAASGVIYGATLYNTSGTQIGYDVTEVNNYASSGNLDTGNIVFTPATGAVTVSSYTGAISGSKTIWTLSGKIM